MLNLILRPCTPEDAEKISQISAATFSEAYASFNSAEDIEKYIHDNLSVDQMRRELMNPDSYFFLVEDEDEGDLVAFMKVNVGKAQTLDGYDNSLELQRMYVLDDYQGRRIGHSLMNKALELARSMKLDYIWLDVLEHSINAIRFYEKLGYVKVDYRQFKLGDSQQPEQIMKLTLL